MDLTSELKQCLKFFAGRPRHFFDRYLVDIFHSMKTSKPQNRENMLNFLLKTAERSKSTLAVTYKEIMKRYSQVKFFF